MAPPEGIEPSSSTGQADVMSHYTMEALKILIGKNVISYILAAYAGGFPLSYNQKSSLEPQRVYTKTVKSLLESNQLSRHLVGVKWVRGRESNPRQ